MTRLSEKRARELCRRTGQKWPGKPPRESIEKQAQQEINEGEETFAYYWRLLASWMPVPCRQYRIDEDRYWRADFAWPEQRLVVEIDGDVHQIVRHQGQTWRNRKQVEDDIVKANALTERGWRVLTYTPEQLRYDPAGCIEQVCRVLGGERL